MWPCSVGDGGVDADGGDCVDEGDVLRRGLVDGRCKSGANSFSASREKLIYAAGTVS